MKKFIFCAATSIALSGVLGVQPGAAQLLPQPWVSVGVQDSEATFSAGVRAVGLGVEIGLTNESAVGIDVMKFISPPFVEQVSGYVGVGLYNNPDSSDRDFAFSGGVQVFPRGNFFFGAGYHTIRGVNGQVGFRLF